MTIVFFFLNYSSIEDAIITMIQLINKTSVENIAKSLVIVMGASSDHFGELLSTIGSFQCYHKETTIFVFNLGLTTHEIHMINKIKSVKLKYYNFSENPYFADASGGCTFKVHIINKMSKNYDIVLWTDMSIRILKPMSSETAFKISNYCWM